MKSVGNVLVTVMASLVVLAITAPRLISLSHALLPVLVVAIVGAAGLRLLWFHTRRF